MKPLLRLLPLAGPLVLGCHMEPEPLDPSALSERLLAFESEIDAVALTGLVRIGTGECGGGAATLRRPTQQSLRFVSTNGEAVAQTSHSNTYGADNALSYSALLQRNGNDAQPLTWQHRNSQNSSAYASFEFGGTELHGSSRRLSLDPGDFTSLATGGLIQNIEATQTTSVTVVIETPWLDASDDAVGIRFSGTSGTSRQFHHITGICYRGEGYVTAGEPGPACTQAPAGATPATVNGWFHDYLRDADGHITGQRIRAEALVVPGASYTAGIHVQLRDGITITNAFTLESGLLTPCGELVLSVAAGNCSACFVQRPPQTVTGTMFFRSPEFEGTGQGARAKTYHHVFYDGSSTRLGYTPGGSLIPFATDGLSAQGYAWRGSPVARFASRVQSPSSNTGDGFRRAFSHVLLDWGGARPMPPSQAPWSYLQPMFRFPRAGATHPNEVTTPSLGLDASGHFYVDPNETQIVNRYAEMAYIRGRVDLLGCDMRPANIQFGTAEVEGVSPAGSTFPDEKGTTRTSAPGNLDGFARGLFFAGNHLNAGEFEIAASAGPWREEAYRLELAGLGADTYRGRLFVWPSDASQFDLTPGRANEDTSRIASPRELQVTRVAVQLRVPDGQLLRNPRLTIGGDLLSNRVPFQTSGGDPLGNFYAVGFNGDTDVSQSFVTLVAMANSLTTIVPSAEVSTNGGQTWSARTDFPVLANVDLSGSCGVCFTTNDEGQTIPVTDDGSGPSITFDPIAIQPAGTTSYHVTGTATDTTPISSIIVNGQTVTATPGPGTYSATFGATIQLTPGFNTVTVTARDCLGNITIATTNVFVAAEPEPLCQPEEIPLECSPEEGGAVFYVGVIVNGIHGSVRCVAWPDQAPTCDTDTLLDNQCLGDVISPVAFDCAGIANVVSGDRQKNGPNQILITTINGAVSVNLADDIELNDLCCVDGCCGAETSCEAAAIPPECASGAATVFYIGVDVDGTPGWLRCVEEPGQAPACASTPTFQDQCGN